MNIEWRDIAGYNGAYQVSNTGLVRRSASFRVNSNQVGSWIHLYPERVFKPSKNTQGYLQITLLINGPRRVARIHRLVAETFLKPPSKVLVEECKRSGLPYVVVNHINFDITDNRVENLEWCSSAHNNIHANENDRRAYKKGEDVYNTKLTREAALEIYYLSKNKIMSQEKIAEIYNIKQITVSNIKTGKSWGWVTGEKNTKIKYGVQAKAMAESVKS